MLDCIGHSIKPHFNVILCPLDENTKELPQILACSFAYAAWFVFKTLNPTN